MNLTRLLRKALGLSHSQPKTEVEEHQPAAIYRNTEEKILAEMRKDPRNASLLSDPDKIRALGQAAYDGDDTEQDFVAAANFYRVAAEAGNAMAQHNLSLMYEYGEGVDRDDAEALEWCIKAAEQGHAGSQNNLGVRFETGQGVNANIVQAARWYSRASIRGDEQARQNLLRVAPDMSADLERLAQRERERGHCP